MSDRRDFFKVFFNETEAFRQKANSSLVEYDKPLSRLEVKHLLKRATFGFSHALIDQFTGKKASELVDFLFANADKKTNPNPPFFSTETFKNPEKLTGNQKDIEANKKELHLNDYNIELGAWWVNLMGQDSDSVLEKMVLFWHGHFATQFSICNNIPAVSMYKQNDLFRKNYAGNFRTLLEKISIDGAMLRYLNGNENISESPNENYARELMELFSIGVGNYSEQDIREAAKVLTGWQVYMFTDEGTPYEPSLNPNKFDKNSKLFMGEVISVDYEITQQNVYEKSVKKLINVILSKKTKAAASFMSNKLYRYFVYSNPSLTDQKVIDQMAEVLIINNFEIKPLLKTLFKSQHFFDELNIGVQLKSPPETLIGFSKYTSFQQKSVRNQMGQLGMALLNPPNVAGWKGYRNWISTKTLPLSIYFLKQILENEKDEQLGAWIKTFSNYDDPLKFVEKLCDLYIAKNVSAARIKKFSEILLGGAPDYEWYEIVKNNAVAGRKLRVLMLELFKAPDFYLF